MENQNEDTFELPERILNDEESENIKSIEEYKEKVKEKLDEKESEEIRLILGNVYEEIIKALKNYCDLKERDYKIIALWIIGTYFYKEFISYPYLFLNAMKGSGKSRTLRLITSLAWNGKPLTALTEAVLFRMSGHHTLGIDEFERIMSKENRGLREILNASYKKGMTISRMKKVKSMTEEKQVEEIFEPYCPVVMANIWGMEEVLGDRCIAIMLDKSNKESYTKKMEDYENDVLINDIKLRLNKVSMQGSVVKCCYFAEKKVYREWNDFINNIYTLNTLTTYNTPQIKENSLKNQMYSSVVNREAMFIKINGKKIHGRDLELFFPLLLIAHKLDPFLFDEILNVAEEITLNKREEDVLESTDVTVIEFVSKQESNAIEWVGVTNLFNEFSNYSQIGISIGKRDDWFNCKWFGRALKRLDLILKKRRLGKGIEVILNVKKAQEKLRMFN